MAALQSRPGRTQNLAWLLGTGLLGLASAGAPVLAQASAPVADPPRAAAPAAPRSSDPAIVRREIEDLLRRVALAVSAGDQAGYMACVALADETFANEQRNWAKDLSRAVPESFDVALGEGEIELEADGSARADLEMNWRMPGGKDRSIAFPVRFVRGGGRVGLALRRRALELAQG